MKATDFPEATAKLLPPEGEEENVYPLPIWRHPEGGMVISKWEMTWRERIACFWNGHVWFHSWRNTHPPVTIETTFPFESDKVPFGQDIRRSVLWVLFLAILLVAGIAALNFIGVPQ